MQSCLDKIKNALLTVPGLSVSHYETLKKTAPYCVWAEDGGGEQLNANNTMSQQAVSGTIDYYTKTESDTTVDAIQAALKTAKISFALYLVQYEDDTKMIHYQWTWETS